MSLRNRGDVREPYSILRDGTVIETGQIDPRAKRTATVTVRENSTVTVAVTSRDKTVESARRSANCVTKSKKEDPTLPQTGPGDATILARLATGLAAMVTGVIVFWYGRLWPGRRSQMFD